MLRLGISLLVVDTARRPALSQAFYKRLQVLENKHDVIVNAHRHRCSVHTRPAVNPGRRDGLSVHRRGTHLC